MTPTQNINIVKINISIIEAKDWFTPLILDDMISNLIQDDILLPVLYDFFSVNVYRHEI